MKKTTLRFRGGPLDDAVRTETVPDTWAVVRYERMADRKKGTRYVYAGCRTRSCNTVRMTYVGTVEGETAADD